MRFERLLLEAYGPFSSVELDLSGGTPGGLHVVFGPNEAGKSTSLRAVKALLFGVPHLSPDSHTHGGNRLRISAEISANGETHFLTRLKRRKDDLVDRQGRVLSPDPLPQMLGNLDELTFSSRFGLDQEDLRRGAEALLGGSEEGLFAAGTAGADVRGILAELKESSDALYKSRGRVLPLNRQLLAFESSTRDAKRAERPPEKWLEQHRAWEEKVAEAETLQGRRAEVRTELRRLNRLRAQMSDLSAWHETSERLVLMGRVPKLPPEARTQRIDAETFASEAKVEARRIRLEIEQFVQEMSLLPSRSPLADIDDDQLSLSTRVGTALSARNDLPKRRAELLVEERALTGYLMELGCPPEPGREIETAHNLLLRATSTAMVGRLLTQRGGLAARELEAERTLKRIISEVQMVERKLETPARTIDLDKLADRLADAQAEQANDIHTTQDKKRILVLEKLIEGLREQFGLTLPTLKLAPLIPSAAWARACVSRHRDCLKKHRATQEEIERLQLEIRMLHHRLTERGADRLPSEQSVEESRGVRDRRVAEAESNPSAETFDALRSSIGTADNIVDSLRRQARRVAEATELRRLIETHRERIEGLGTQFEVLDTERRGIEVEHAAFLCSIQTTRNISILDIEDFCAGLRQLLLADDELQGLNALAEDFSIRLREVKKSLSECLGEADADTGLPGLIARASRLLHEGLESKERRKSQMETLNRLQASAADAESELAQAKAEFSTWEDEWEKAVAPLGLSRDASVQRAQEVLAILERTVRTLDAAGTLSGRIVGMERNTASLAEDVFAIAERHRPELLQLDPVDAAVELQQGIRSARRDDDERLRLKKLTSERRAELSRVESRETAAQERLTELMRLAEVDSASQLPGVEAAVEEVRTLNERLAELEKSVRKSSGGASIEELWPEASKWRGKVGALVDRINDLDEESQQLEEQYRRAESDCVGYRLGLDTYNSESVAILRQFAASKRAEAVTTLREYLLRSCAHRLLAQQVTRHAERFAGPIVERARSMFERLTLGRYTGLDVGIGEKTLRCVRGREVLEVSQLSTGTRAQLYLALRLASLENYFERQPSVPLVFDDLLLEFDDDRATVAFEILGEMAKKVQILYFTHLARDVESAEIAVSGGGLFQHRIGVV